MSGEQLQSMMKAEGYASTPLPHISSPFVHTLTIASEPMETISQDLMKTTHLFLSLTMHHACKGVALGG